jgi:ribosomal-protein-alanine N-acetyltransferase
LTEAVFHVLAEIYRHSPWSRDQIMSDLSRPETCYFLVYDEKQLIGFLATQTIIDELEITNLAIISNYRRQGLAEQLLHNLAGFHGTLFLEVREGNLPARQLYEKCGFAQFNRRKDYYANPSEDALLLRKTQ